MILRGSSLLTVRRPASRPEDRGRESGPAGLILSATALKATTPAWETRLGAPLIADPEPDAHGTGVLAATAAGLVYHVPASGPTVSGQSFQLSGGDDGQATGVAWGDGVAAVGFSRGQTARLLVYDTAMPEKPLREIRLPARLAAPPLAVGGGLLAPLDSGLVTLLDLHSGARLAQPFQPPLAAGAHFTGRPALAAGLGPGDQVLLSDGSRRLYSWG